MGQLFYNIRVIVDDLKQSWYFRIWGLLWAICLIFAFTCLIILSKRADEAGRDKDFRMWVANVSEIQFPRFHFRISRRQSPGLIITNKTCTHGELLLQTGPCVQWRENYTPAPDECFAVPTDGIVALNDWNAPPGDERIYCTIQTSGYTAETNMMIAFELEGEYATFGSNSGASVCIAPNDAAWVLLEKGIIKSPGQKPQEAWERTLLYHSTQSTIPGRYNVAIILGTFRVEYFEASDSYNGWMALGGIGGFSYWLVILHTIVLMAVGLALNNDSKFLQSGRGGAVGDERTSML